jgi:hypothetical protein
MRKIPDIYFQVSVIDDSKVRVGLSSQFSEAVGQETISDLNTLGHFSSNRAAARRAGITDDQLAELKRKVDNEAKGKTGFTYSHLHRAVRQIEKRLNQSGSPVQEAKNRGLTFLRDTIVPVDKSIDWGSPENTAELVKYVRGWSSD